MSDNETKFVITVDASGAVSTIKTVGDNLKNVKSAAESAGDGFTKFERDIVVANQAAQLTTTVVNGLFTALKAIPNALEQAQKIEGVTRAFENLQAKAGALASDTLVKLNVATHGLISDLDLMKQANQAVLLGLPNEGFDKLAAAALKLGQAMGQDATKSISDVVEGLGRGSFEVLNNLGVILKAEDAYKRYAEQLHTTADALTDQQKVMAFQVIGAQDVIKKAQDLADGQQTAAQAYTNLTKEITDQRNKAFESLSQNEDLVRVIKELAEAVAKVDLQPLINGLVSVVGAAEKAAKSIYEFANGPIGDLIDKGLNNMAAALRASIPGLSLYAAGQQELARREQESTEQVKKKKEALDELFPTLAFGAAKMKELPKALSTDQLGKLVEDYASKLRGLQNESKTNILNAAEYDAKLKSLKAAFIGAGGSSERFSTLLSTVKKNLDAPTVKKYNDELERQVEIAKKLNSADGLMGISNEVKRLYEGMTTGTITAKKYAEEILGIKAKLDKANVPQDDQNAAIGSGLNPPKPKEESKGLGEGIAEAIGEQIVSGISSAFESGSFRDAIAGIGVSIGQVIGAKVGETIGKELGKSLGDSLGTGIGGLVGSSLGPVGSAIGSALGQKIIGGLIEDLSGAGKNAKGNQKAFSTAFGHLMAPFTAGGSYLISDTLGKKLFGESAGTSARKQADKFFADVFDGKRLTVVINDQIQQISDLQFSGNQEGGIFASLSQSAQEAFTQIGTAMEGIIGISSELGVNVGTVLANNLGGDLNNLQLLVEATGQSFDALSEKIINTFLQGDSAILDTVTSLQSLHEIMSKGIPGATGAVGRAFDRVFSAGAKGGKELLDAIADVGYEFKEIGGKDLPTLYNSLVNTFGKGSAQVQLFFNAMKVAGVNSLEELLNASNTMLIAVAGNVQKAIAGQTADITGASLGDTTTKAVTTGGGGGGGSYKSSSARAPKAKPADKTKNIAIGFVDSLTNPLVRSVSDAIKAVAELDDSFKGLEQQKFFKGFLGDLNSMEVVAQRLGITFQEMQNKIVASFQASKISASEANKALAEATQGIPGVVGGVVQAVGNLKSFGTQGGAFSIDALRDIGAEAKDLFKGVSAEDRQKMIEQRALESLKGKFITSNILKSKQEEVAKNIDSELNPFAQLKKSLGDNSDMKALFGQFEKFGIDTIEEIQNVSDTVATQIIGGLQDSGFAFEQTKKSITDLNNEVTKLQEIKEVKIEVNITKANISKEAQKELNEAVGPSAAKEILAYVKKNIKSIGNIDFTSNKPVSRA